MTELATWIKIVVRYVTLFCLIRHQRFGFSRSISFFFCKCDSFLKKFRDFCTRASALKFKFGNCFVGFLKIHSINFTLKLLPRMPILSKNFNIRSFRNQYFHRNFGWAFRLSGDGIEWLVNSPAHLQHNRHTNQHYPLPFSECSSTVIHRKSPFTADTKRVPHNQEIR